MLAGVRRCASARPCVAALLRLHDQHARTGTGCDDGWNHGPGRGRRDVGWLARLGVGRRWSAGGRRRAGVGNLRIPPGFPLPRRQGEAQRAAAGHALSRRAAARSGRRASTCRGRGWIHARRARDEPAYNSGGGPRSLAFRRPATAAHVPASRADVHAASATLSSTGTAGAGRAAPAQSRDRAASANGVFARDRASARGDAGTETRAHRRHAAAHRAGSQP